MSMKRTPEWYEAYQRKQVTRKANTEIAWTDNVTPVKLERVYPLVTLCRQTRIAEPVPEFRFHPTRKWRFDFAGRCTCSRWKSMAACGRKGGIPGDRAR